MTKSTLQVDPLLLGEAADWLMRQRSGEMTDEERLSFQHWRARSTQHAAAWKRAEAVLDVLGRMPADIGRGTLTRLGNGRRRTLQTLGLFVLAAPATWLAWRRLPWEEWTADVRTATGQQKTMDLADGTRLVLNTASAVNIAFTATGRHIHLLGGEILLTTGRDPSPVYRPFVVRTPQCAIRALGTRFSVRRIGEGTQIAVFEAAVEVQSQYALPLILNAGEQTLVDHGGAHPARPVDGSAELWAQGMLLARNMRLADLVAELSRYRSGIVRCDPEVADLPVSGAFPLRDTDRSLGLLEKTLPLRIGGLGRYWVVIGRR